MIKAMNYSFKDEDKSSSINLLDRIQDEIVKPRLNYNNSSSTGASTGQTVAPWRSDTGASAAKTVAPWKEKPKPKIIPKTISKGVVKRESNRFLRMGTKDSKTGETAKKGAWYFDPWDNKTNKVDELETFPQTVMVNEIGEFNLSVLNMTRLDYEFEPDIGFGDLIPNHQVEI
jgi:hypothetical protein